MNVMIADERDCHLISLAIFVSNHVNIVVTSDIDKSGAHRTREKLC